jgi:hypothetical protein
MPNKAMAAGAAGAVTVILVWVLGTFGHIVVPPEVSSALTTIISSLAAYAAPHESAS